VLSGFVIAIPKVLIHLIFNVAIVIGTIASIGITIKRAIEYKNIKRELKSN